MASIRTLLGTLVLAAAVLPSGAARAEDANQVPLPEAVDKTFKAMFPGAQIEKLTAEKEEGVTVYDFEFKHGENQKETDIAADGTMLEWTLVVPQDSIPAPVMKVINRHAKGATLGRLERIDVKYELADGKVKLLPKPVLRYAAEMTKGDMAAEVIVNADGKVFESPEWVSSTLQPAVK